MLPTDRLRKVLKPAAPPTDKPFATAYHDGRRRIVAAVDQLSRGGGLGQGCRWPTPACWCPSLWSSMPIRQPTLPGCIVLPLPSADPPDGIWLDVTRCTDLWGNEQVLLGDLQGRHGRAGFRSCAALADTPGAAHAVARFGGAGGIVVPPGCPAGNSKLTYHGSEAAGEDVGGLRRVGFETIDNLMGAPRSQLALRFGPGSGRGLDQLVGLLFKPIDPVHQEDAIDRRLPFVETISTPEAICIAIDRLVDLVCQYLAAGGLGRPPMIPKSPSSIIFPFVFSGWNQLDSR